MRDKRLSLKDILLFGRYCRCCKLFKIIAHQIGTGNPWADQFLSDERGADFPEGCIGALLKRLLGLWYYLRHIVMEVLNLCFPCL